MALLTIEQVSEESRSASVPSSEGPFRARPGVVPGGKTARAYRLLAFVLLVRPFGNLCLTWGMKHFSQVLSWNPFGYLQAMMNPFVALGIGMLILALLLRMALLSVADLSVVLPLTSIGYVVSALLGKFVLREQISGAGWLGTLLIFLGTVVVGSSRKTEERLAVPE